MRFAVDFTVLDTDGASLSEIIPMGEVILHSRTPAINVFLEITYNLGSAPPDDYLLQTEITDLPSGRRV